MKTKTEILSGAALMDLFVQSGALLKGHFQLSSGLHGDQYMQCALLLSDPARAAKLGAALAALAPEKPDIVVSPAMGGVIIGHEVARALGVRAIFAERENGAMTLRRGFTLRAGEKALIVEDVFTTGKSTMEVVVLLRTLGAHAQSALSIVNRASATLSLDIEAASLLHMPLASWRPEDCPLCRKKIPVQKPGSRGLK